MDDGDEDRGATSAAEGIAAVSGTKLSPVWFCSNVGGGIFGEWQTAAWRNFGLNARLHSAVELDNYWRAKSGVLSRLRLRWAMYASYPLRLRNAISRAVPGETFVTVTNPFFLPAMAARTARGKGARIINLVYDLYPDALVFGGGWSPRHPAARLAAWSTRVAIAECAATVYLGHRLQCYAESQYGIARRSAVIPVGTDTSVFHECWPTLRTERVVRCLYSGHMGRLHDWQTLAQGLGGGVPTGLRIEIASDGPGAMELRRGLRNVAGNGSLVFSGTRGDAEWREAMLAADVAFVTMRPGAEKVVMPSKTYSAMAAGQAVLAICPRESDLADLILKHDCGWVVEPGDVTGLKSLLGRLPERCDEILAKRRNAYSAAHTHYSMEATGRQWVELFSALNES